MHNFTKTSVQFYKYFGAALVGYAVDLGVLIFCKEVLQLHYLVGAILGFTAGLVVVYLLSNRYVFGESKIKSKSTEFGIFAIIGIIGLILLTFLMWVMTDVAHINYLLSKILATGVVYIWNFFARKSLYHD